VAMSASPMPSALPSKATTNPCRKNPRRTCRGRADRPANADLARAAADQERKHAVESDGAEKQDESGGTKNDELPRPGSPESLPTCFWL
jgi:hypothetical protein